MLTELHRIVIGDRIKLVVKNDLVFDDVSIEYTLQDVLKPQQIVLTPKPTASYTVQVNLIDEFFTSLIPNQQLTLWAGEKTYISKSNNLGVATFDVGLPWSKVKNTTAKITFEQNDLFFSAAYDLVLSKPT